MKSKEKRKDNISPVLPGEGENNEEDKKKLPVFVPVFPAGYGP